MTIYTVCIDPERGRYLAFTTTEPMLKTYAYANHAEAVGKLVMLPQFQKMPIDQIINIDDVDSQA